CLGSWSFIIGAIWGEKPPARFLLPPPLWGRVGVGGRGIRHGREPTGRPPPPTPPHRGEGRSEGPEPDRNPSPFPRQRPSRDRNHGPRPRSRRRSAGFVWPIRSRAAGLSMSI